MPFCSRIASYHKRYCIESGLNGLGDWGDLSRIWFCLKMMRSYLISSSWFKRVGNGRHNVRLPDIYLNLLPWEQYTGLILGAWYYSNETWPTRSWTRPTWLCHLAGKLYSHQRPDSAQSWTILNCYARFKKFTTLDWWLVLPDLWAMSQPALLRHPLTFGMTQG